MRYDTPSAGEWVQPVRRGYKMRCCDCGLVHKMDFRVVNRRVQFRVFREQSRNGSDSAEFVKARVGEASAMTDERDAEAIAHEIMLHFPEAEWEQALAAGALAMRRIERNRTEYEYAIREDWSFHQGVETILPVGGDLNFARTLARILDDLKDDPNHSVLRRRVDIADDWHEWSDENDRRRLHETVQQ